MSEVVPVRRVAAVQMQAVLGDVEANLELAEQAEEEQFPERRGDIAVDYAASSAKDVVSLQRKLFRLRADARNIRSPPETLTRTGGCPSSAGQYRPWQH